jgi:hypothetical protein
VKAAPAEIGNLVHEKASSCAARSAICARSDHDIGRGLPCRRSCPEVWCRSDAPWRAGPPGQAATAGRLTAGLSLTAPMVSSVM